MLLLGLLAFLFSLALTPAVRSVGMHFGLVDEPSGGRKIHRTPVPRLGGAALLLSVLAAGGVCIVFSLPAASELSEALVYLKPLSPAVFVIFLVGLADDVFGLRAWHKLLGQVLAAVLAFSSGLRVSGFAGIEWTGTATETWWSLAATTVWLVACANAFNLIDGLDGLAAGLGLLAASTVMLAAILSGDSTMAIAIAPILGCLIGFLVYNFHPATIFLGDSGSLMTGFVLGSFAIIWSQKSATLLGMAAPLITLSLPLIDVCLAILRRFLRRQPIFSPDRGHIHHRLLDQGWSVRRTVLCLYGASALAAGFSLVYSRMMWADVPSAVGSVLVVLYPICVFVGIRHLGYREFDVLAQVLSGGALRTMIGSQLRLRDLEDALRRAQSREDFACAVVSAARQLRINAGKAHVGESDISFGTSEGETRAADRWELLVTLSADDFVILERNWGDARGDSEVLPFAEALRKVYYTQFSRQRSRAEEDHGERLPLGVERKVGALSAEVSG